jgi:hypothetical protein
VFDATIQTPHLAWEDGHVRQGFARRNSQVSFVTLVEWGEAALRVFVGAFAPKPEHTRVIEVPFELLSQQVGIEQPEDAALQRVLQLEPGHYRLVAAQTLDGGRLSIDLWFETLDTPLDRSRVRLADPDLDPPETLLESAEIA